MKKYVIIILFFCGVSNLRAQKSHFYQSIDTLKATYKTGGEKLDSIDIIYSEKFITTPSSFLSDPFDKYSNDYTSFFQNLQRQHRFSNPLRFKFTALPHLSTYYAFGSKGTQYLDVNYNQSFSQKLHFNLKYNRNVATGAFRLNGFTKDHFSLGLLYKGEKWNQLVSFSNLKQQRNLNGGITSYDEIEQYGLAFAKVRKSNSNDTISTFNFTTESEWKFLIIDSSKHIGLIFKNNFLVDKRVFREKDSLIQWYPNSILFDSLSTRDLTQYSRLDNSIGLRFKHNNLISEILIDKGYWLYKTATYQYKNEIDILGNLYLELKKSKINLENKFNLLGAQQQHFSHFSFFNSSKIGSILVDFNYSNLLPSPMQRVYITNTLAYITNPLKLQQTKSTLVTFSTNSNQKITVSGNYINFKNHYYFIQNQWRNDTLTSINLLTLQLKADFQFKAIHFQPNLTFNYLNKTSSVPKYDLRARIFVSKNFKREGTFAQLGLDVNYKSTYQLLSFDERISLYKLSSNNNTFEAYTVIDPYVQMQMDEFRMYFKVENIYNSNALIKNQIAENYPIAPLIMRIGITWDFIN